MIKLRILLADDHAVVREGLKALVNAQPDMEVVGEAADGRAAWQLATELRPDVVVMDVSMPALCGAEATTRLRRDCPDVKVLALTVHEDGGYLRQLFEAGAAGYVLKRAAAEELVQAIRAVASGGTYLDPKMAGQVVGGYVGRPTAQGVPLEAELTEREIEVVRLLARGYINREIAEHLDLSVKTVEVHKARALEKLGLRSRADLVQYALRRGWLQES
ncbi:MAG: response regulator transcription factor [Planctomycetaceae bacterium]|nr:response regulator transcription factor [Planctomycetaceae bacterium]